MIGCHLLQNLAIEPLSEYLIFSSDRKDIRSLNQDVGAGGLGLFHCSKIRLRAMSEAKAMTSKCDLVKLVGIGGTPKMAINRPGSNVILRALPNVSKKQDQNSVSSP